MRTNACAQARAPRRIIISVFTLCARRPTLRAHGARTCARTIGGDGLRDRIKRVHSVQILRNAQHSLLNNLNLDGTLTAATVVSTITWTARPKETVVASHSTRRLPFRHPIIPFDYCSHCSPCYFGRASESGVDRTTTNAMGRAFMVEG